MKGWSRYEWTLAACALVLLVVAMGSLASVATATPTQPVSRSAGVSQMDVDTMALTDPATSIVLITTHRGGECVVAWSKDGKNVAVDCKQ